MRRTLSWPRAGSDAEDPSVRGRLDWLLAAAVLATATAEAAARHDVVWSSVAIVVGLTLASTMLWRRTRPLATVALGFGALTVMDLASMIADARPIPLYTGAVVVVLAYALFRWGTRRQVTIGAGIVLVAWVVSVTTDFSGLTDAIGGLVALLFVGALGAAIRYRRIVSTQQLEWVRSHERETLARELHDTVAHHVSAIAISAQAGQLLAKSADLDGAAGALEIIEQEASRTLAEMRSMVGTLRHQDGPQPEFTQRGVTDIERLATVQGAPGLRVDVERHGDLTDLRPTVEAALFRVAQESVTNSQRHARRATRVCVLITGDPESVRLDVIDDGERTLSGLRQPGYGLVGMAERVGLLGGTLEAGPSPERGWTVEALIPKEGRSA